MWLILFTTPQTRQRGCTSEYYCFGFVDGTVRPTARPDQHQRVMYNGHKRVHAIKFQSLVLLNGLVANLYGPVGSYIFQGAVFINYQ